MRVFAALLALMFSLNSHAAEETLRFYGYAYDLKTQAHLYTEVHQQQVREGRWRGGTITYFDPAGKKIGAKTLDFSKDPYVPVFRTDLFYKDYYESITDITADGITLSVKHTGKAPETKTIRRRAPQAGDSGLHPMILDKLADLQAGKTVPFRLALAGALDDYRFKISKKADVNYSGVPAIELIMKPDSLLSIVADDLFFVYDPARRKLLEYRGLSNLHDPQTGDPWLTRIVYPDVPPADIKVLPPLD